MYIDRCPRPSGPDHREARGERSRRTYPGQTLLTCNQLDAPIVLAHGLFGYDRIGVGRLTITSYFRGIPDYLRAGGNRVVLTRVPPIAGVKARARVLAEQIDRACPGQAVHLIGHSMGGLDARQLLASPAWAGRILSLTTVGTPHLGSALADWSRLRAGPVLRLLRTMKINHHGFLDLTRRAANAVNRNGFRDHGVPCFCVAGDPKIDLVCWPLKRFHVVLSELEGPNDGLVSVQSAQGFGTPLPSWPVDHLRQLNWLSPPRGPSSAAEICRLYGSVVENLASIGFAASEPRETPVPAEATSHTRRSKTFGQVFLRDPHLLGFRAGRAVKEDGHGHVAEDVGGGPAPVQEPIDGQ